MDNESIAALVGFVIFGVFIFVALFTVARLLMRDRRVRQVRIGFYMERDRDRYSDDDDWETRKVVLPPQSSEAPTQVMKK